MASGRSAVPGRAARWAGLAWVALAFGAGPNEPPTTSQAPDPPATLPALDAATQRLAPWMRHLPARDQAVGFGLIVIGVLGLSLAARRRLALREGRIAPRDFVERLRDRLNVGKLDKPKALDLCEVHPSPAARVAQAVFQRWGRPAADLERVVGLAARLEIEPWRQSLAGLRRLAILSFAIGLCGGIGDSEPLSWILVGSLAALGHLFLYDALLSRAERLGVSLERLGWELVEGVGSAASATAPPAAETVRPRSSGPVLSRGPNGLRVDGANPIVPPPNYPHPPASRPLPYDDDDYMDDYRR